MTLALEMGYKVQDATGGLAAHKLPLAGSVLPLLCEQCGRKLMEVRGFRLVLADPDGVVIKHCDKKCGHINTFLLEVIT